ncbi:carbon-nitrogen hydrolase family protein [Nocardioides mangrovicus]|uniref:Carbon-nitrogen hydrolase family protein n=1 Tax=Nocardioides mangrovicus TaxID=2478913 RepID=A0A3L8P594_9ACTN|nr:carbon-nitrogen hydrolase family protein [Nocardioides mangrovicus]RLV50556.1 carbon-nitrogen hydrolase family protein [Nocardioides mangrovicus]
MSVLAALAGWFGRDVEANLARIDAVVEEARSRGVELLALPEACLGGYLAALDSTDAAGADGDEGPPVMDIDGPELSRVARAARDMTVVVGLCESDGTDRYNSAVAVTGDGVLGVHRKVHQPLGEGAFYAAGDVLAAVDSPAGRLGMLICYDKGFPEAARTLALDGADVITCISAWPASRTATAADLDDDRWTHRFDLFDRVRALENQVVWVASNQTGTFGTLRFVGHAKVVGPGGEVLAVTGVDDALAVAELDVPDAIATARRSMSYLRDRRPEVYLATEPSGA